MKLNQKVRKKKDLESKKGQPIKRKKMMLKTKKMCPNLQPKTNVSISNDFHRLIFSAFNLFCLQSQASRK
jgi:hypothetical protein